ncbi:hypothetical protein B9Z19DRAFT_1086221 [Tuber borchii]|uniref:N-acetyltransferase domain-containing protein n=1 Tax=Tuber borchii TaxID=42251 RepID=A0A2T6ZPU9_TUBBO|nr:hypothetical protein B9Z19DRAFT_1086221 [Tuber borchii]
MAVLFFVGYAIAVLSACGYLTYGYIERAEWLGSRSGLAATLGGDRKMEVVGALWGEEVIGVVVFERVKGEREKEKKKKKKKGGDGGEEEEEEGVIYGWAVRLRYRGKGVGRGLLEKVAEICEGRVRFAEDHVRMFTPPTPVLFFFFVSDGIVSELRDIY